MKLPEIVVQTGLVLTLASTLLVNPARTNERDVCALFHGEEEMVTHVLYMHQENVRHELRIPTVYFEDAWDRVDGAEHDAQLFSVMIDDFTPVYRRHTATLKKAGRHDYMTFLLQDYVGNERLTEIVLSTATGGKSREISEALRQDADFDLVALRAKEGIEQNKDVYISEDAAGDIRTVFLCSQMGDVKSPGCSQYFRSHAIDIKVNYRRVFLAQWKGFEIDVDSFLACALNFE
ncbi:hypothetical protein [Roseobacter weihaiensis]|uniref:hypothetical protein n=1 Tax=Roseobacter weihaiensis TaxID=2763262 RepID=UPI001D0A8A00|nr:hypothetical protein [Roseobacter sp. H9]